jgi:hypothetical protein
MPVPLAYEFKAIGLPLVKAAIRSNERALIGSNARILRNVQATRAAMGRPGAMGAAGTVGAAARMGPAAAVAAGAPTHVRRRLTQEQWLEREKTREALRSQRALARMRERDLLRENRERTRADVTRLRTRERVERESRRKAERSAAAQARTAERAAIVQARSMATSRTMVRRSMVGAAGRSVTGAVGTLGRYALLSTGLMGGFAAGAAIGHAKRVEQASAELANQAYRAGSGVSRKEIAERVTRTAQTEGIRTGLGAEGIIEGLRQFVAISGNLPAGLSMAGFMADIADATGASIEDVGRTGGQIMQAMMAREVPETEALEQTMEIFRSMAAQAKLGSIEFRDMATQMGSLISSTSRFSGPLDDLAATMGAMAQLAIAGGASSPEEAMTSIKRFSDDLIQNAKRWEKMIASKPGTKGMTFFTDEKKTRLRNPIEIMLDIFKVTGGDLTKVKQLFGIRSMKAIEPFQQAFTAVSGAVEKEGGGEAAVETVRRRLARFRGAKMEAKELRGSAAAARRTTARRIDIATESFKQAVGEKLLPVVAELIPHFEKLIPHLATAAKWLGRFVQELERNPWETIGKLIALKVSASILAAGIGTAVKGAILRSIGPGMGAGVVGGGAVARTAAAGAGGATTIIGGTRAPARGGPLTQRALGRVSTAAPAIGTTAGGALIAGLTGLSLGTVTAEALKVGLITSFHGLQEQTTTEAQRGAYLRRTGDRRRLEEHLVKTRAEYEKTEERTKIAEWARKIATNPLTNPLGALLSWASGMGDVSKEMIEPEQRFRAGEIKKTQEWLEAPSMSWDAFVADMGGATEGLSALGATVQKVNTELAKIKVPAPNRGDKPTSANPRA